LNSLPTAQSQSSYVKYTLFRVANRQHLAAVLATFIAAFPADWRSCLPPFFSSASLQDDIKKAYRKKALRWHPDKNHGNDDATEVFQRIQAAHTVLSDKHERGWYDSHREQILRGNVDGEDEGPEAFEMSLFNFFDASCYEGYEEDTENNFFDVYQECFEDIAEWELKGAIRSSFLRPSRIVATTIITATTKIITTTAAKIITTAVTMPMQRRWTL
jgi:DnaJ family protein A protein 5